MNSLVTLINAVWNKLFDNIIKWKDFLVNPLSAKLTKWLLPTNYLSVFDHFVGLALKGLKQDGALIEKILITKSMITSRVYLLISVTKSTMQSRKSSQVTYSGEVRNRNDFSENRELFRMIY